MSSFTKTRCWVHMIWGTAEGRKNFANYDLRKTVANYFRQYSSSNAITIECVYVNADHVHMLLDLPEKLSMNEMAGMLKKGSADWINISGLLSEQFNWEEGFFAFSVSQSNVEPVKKYIDAQDELHRSESFAEELQHFFEGYGVE